jgi:hypothetical protein
MRGDCARIIFYIGTFYPVDAYDDAIMMSSEES